MRIRVGDKVEPKQPTTKDCLTYGYVRAIWTGDPDRDGYFYAGKLLAEVYWPEIRSGGRWPVDALRRKP